MIKENKGNVSIVVGLQWGDEGKGRVTHYMSKDMDCVIRATGGNNAGHTLSLNGKKHVVHLLPSSVLNPNVVSIIGSAVLVDPIVLLEEMNNIISSGMSLKTTNFLISDRAHVIMPYHKLEDEWYESKKERKIGTTKRGIGPCAADKCNRIGVRMCDLFDKDVLRRKITEALSVKSRDFFVKRVPIKSIIEGMVNAYYIDSKSEFKDVYDEKVTMNSLKDFIKNTDIITLYDVYSGKKFLIEGAQATYLDLDHGNYPFVTSSYPIASGCLSGAGIGPTAVKSVIGVAKAYCSRVGEGPFPTEQANEIGDTIRELGGEYGATTKRPRRCGWLDLVALKYSCMLNGVTELCINHIDTIGKLSTIDVAISYLENNQMIYHVPTDMYKCKPVYKTFKGGWNTDGIIKYQDLPKNCRAYIEFIEEFVGVPIKYIGVGADDTRTIIKE